MSQYYTETSERKPVVVMYYTYPDRVGGPLTYINTIINSDLKEKYTFKTCFQNKAPGGIDIQLLKDMVKELKSLKPDIVHVQGAQSEGFYGVLAAKLAGCKHIIMTIHGFAFDDSSCTGIKHFLYEHIVEPVSIRLSHQVYCVCEFGAKRNIVVKNAGKRNRGYIHNPAPAHHPSVDRGEMRKNLGFYEDDVVFCISGRVTKDKGFDVLAETVRLVNTRGLQNFKLLVIGDGEYFGEFSRCMNEEIVSGQVVMVGQTDEVANYLAASDVFLFPTYHENLSVALLEAGMAGLTSIVSDVGGNAEIVKDGETGFVVKEIVAGVFADKIELLLSDNQRIRRMQIAAKNDISSRFSLSSLCKQIDEVYSFGTDCRKQTTAE